MPAEPDTAPALPPGCVDLNALHDAAKAEEVKAEKAAKTKPAEPAGE